VAVEDTMESSCRPVCTAQGLDTSARDETPSMTIEQVLKIWTPVKLAEVLQTSIQNVCGWLREGKIPRGRQYELQVKSEGRLIASTFDPSRDYVTDGQQRRRA
jgi:hypothetical protein